jgi:hypothetical protein
LAQPSKSREILETNSIPAFSERRLNAKHRKGILVKTPATQKTTTETVVVDKPRTPVKSVEEALELTTAPTEVVEEVVEEVVAVETEASEETVDLESLTKKQLIEVAKVEKVTYKNLTKAELLEALYIVMA